MTSKNVPAHATLTEIGRRINRHIQRIAQEHNEQHGTSKESRKYFCASAFQIGAYVRVIYVSYQGGTNLTRAEALHYLSGLDNGFVGTHFEYFEKCPVPEPLKPKIQFTALVRTGYGFALYAVTKRTERRMYGEQVAGAHVGSWVDRRHVVKLQATEADLEQAQAAWQRLHEEKAAAQVRFQEAIQKIVTGRNNPAAQGEGVGA